LAMVLKVSGYEGESEDAEGMNAVGVVNENPQIRLALSCPKIRAQKNLSPSLCTMSTDFALTTGPGRELHRDGVVDFGETRARQEDAAVRRHAVWFFKPPGATVALNWTFYEAIIT
jgi:hypothetical protein